MNKILLIIKREYLSRVKKKTFLLVTFLVPFFIIGIYALMIVLTKKSFEGNHTNVHVVDQSALFQNKLADNKLTSFHFVSDDVNAEKKKITDNKEKDVLLIIPANVEQTQTVELFSSDKVGFAIQNEISNQMEAILRNQQFETAGIDLKTVESIKPKISINAKELTAEGERDSSTGAAMGVGVVLSILVYLSLFLYGAQVMRGIIEEKNNRIVEVIISSVKPFQLMMGKIVGIGLVGLTQFVLWISLSGGLLAVASAALVDKGTVEAMQQEAMADIADSGQSVKYQEGMAGNFMAAVDKIEFGKIIISFLFYFIGGYMLYSALFAAVGSAVDSETETQQFMFPITMPLLFTYILSFGVLINDPNGSLAFWLSMIPFTSPIAMLVRIPFGVPTWEIALSVALLIGGFILTTWVAGRIYRVGILMYGKKASYKELIKWFRYNG